jgi:hypothetical protein
VKQDIATEIKAMGKLHVDDALWVCQRRASENFA